MYPTVIICITCIHYKVITIKGLLTIHHCATDTLHPFSIFVHWNEIAHVMGWSKSTFRVPKIKRREVCGKVLVLLPGPTSQVHGACPEPLSQHHHTNGYISYSQSTSQAPCWRRSEEWDFRQIRNQLLVSGLQRGCKISRKYIIKKPGIWDRILPGCGCTPWSLKLPSNLNSLLIPVSFNRISSSLWLGFPGSSSLAQLWASMPFSYFTNPEPLVISVTEHFRLLNSSEYRVPV